MPCHGLQKCESNTGDEPVLLSVNSSTGDQIWSKLQVKIKLIRLRDHIWSSVELLTLSSTGSFPVFDSRCQGISVVHY